MLRPTFEDIVYFISRALATCVVGKTRGGVDMWLKSEGPWADHRPHFQLCVTQSCPSTSSKRKASQQQTTPIPSKLFYQIDSFAIDFKYPWIVMPALESFENSSNDPEPLTRLPFKPITRSHILHCSYDYWHPKYTLHFPALALLY